MGECRWSSWLSGERLVRKNGRGRLTLYSLEAPRMSGWRRRQFTECVVRVAVNCNELQIQHTASSIYIHRT